jgi:multidrug efflux pump subunit AcrB
LAGNTTLFIFPLCVLFVFLTLAAQYESWALPFAIILIVPMCILSALAGVLLRRMDNNIFTQIGFVVLVGLACKTRFSSSNTQSRLKTPARIPFPPSSKPASSACGDSHDVLAFIAGVVPLMLGSGAGAEMRQTLGTAVFAGMLGVTIFGIFLTPVFYVMVRKFVSRKQANA